MNIIVPLAPGFEEIEAVTIIDVLRRAALTVTTVTLGTNPVKGAHSIEIRADQEIGSVNAENAGAIVLPGGMPGSENLRNDERVISFIRKIHSAGKPAAAICAAPIVFAKAGILEGKKVTCYPGFENQLAGAVHVTDPIHVDGNVITGRGPGCAIPFALSLVEILKDKDTATRIKESMQVYWM